jgi:hypothetical protein
MNILGIVRASLILITAPTAAQLHAQPPTDPGRTLVAAMAANEIAYRQHEANLGYISEERSARTGNHLWKEKVVETDDGPLPRLIAIDGNPLTSAQIDVESRRIDDLVRNPDDFKAQNKVHLNDERHSAALLELLAKAFLLTPSGDVNGCHQFKFEPDPAFQPSSYEERIGHAMSGTVSLKGPMNRLCLFEGHLSHPVEFGFGLFGHIDQGGSFSMERAQVEGAVWKTKRVTVHIQGRILLLKSLAKDQETNRTDIHFVSQTLTLQQAADLTRP